MASIVPHTPGLLPSHSAFDLFHCVHLGVGKNLASAMIAVFINFEAGNIEQRLLAVTKAYRSWCREHGRAMVISKITKDVLSLQTRARYLIGGWFKADLTTNFLEWIESLDETLDVAAEPVLIPGMEAVKTLNVRMLYELDAWLSPLQAVSAGQIAPISGERSFCFAKQKGPVHLAAKITRGTACGIGVVGTGPDGDESSLCSKQIKVDVIRKTSRLSRRVCIRTVIQRVLERYFQACYEKWVAAGCAIAPKPKKREARDFLPFEARHRVPEHQGLGLFGTSWEFLWG